MIKEGLGLNLFSIRNYLENEEKFKSEEVRKLSRKALEYYEMLEKKKNINFKGWGLFIKLYKYEGFSYSLQNFAVLNLPMFTRILYKFKK